MTTESVRTLFITKNVPYPPIGGVALRNWQNMNIMKKFGSVAVFSASTWSPNYTSAPGIALWKHCNVAKERSSWEQPERRFWWLRRRGHPDADWAYANKAAQELDEVLSQFQPDFVVFEEVWLYRYLKVVKRHNCRIIFDEHNVEADIFQQKYGSPSNLKARLKVRVQLPQVRAIERELIRHSAQIWVCSDADAYLLKQLYAQNAPAYVVPNGVNVADYAQVRSGNCQLPQGLEATSHHILYLGQLAYAPNTVAVGLLIDQIYPRLQQIYPDCRLLLVGRNPTQSMLDAAKQEPGIVITGSVADVRPYLAAASLMVVPLLQGGGTRLKILEAFAAGCPVVSTAKGAEGLAARDGEHLLVRNSIEEIVAGVCQLWSEPSLCEKLTRAAYKLVQAEYSWSAVGQRVEKAVEILINRRLEASRKAAE